MRAQQWFRRMAVLETWPVAFAVTSITPSTGTTAGGTAVDIRGTGFRFGATVAIGGASATSVVFLGSTRITAVTPARTAGAKDVVVTNPSTATATLTGGYTYT